MNSRTRLCLGAVVLPPLALCYLGLAESQAGSGGDPLAAADGSGVLRTFTSTGTIDTGNPFFKSLGTNGRSCVTCHQPGDAWTITPEHLQARFNMTDGTDPVFRTVDGSNSPLADVSSPSARRKAYSMLLNKGVIRIGIGIPTGAEFTLAAVDDPYHYAGAQELSLFRRPLPSTNLRFLTGVMWDARETVSPFLPPMDQGVNMVDLVSSLKQQAIDATAGHAQGTVPLTTAQQQQIVAFEMGLSTAQAFDNQAGRLNASDALGGPRIVSNQEFYIGINDTLGADPTGALFNSSAMTLFSGWQDPAGSGDDNHNDNRNDARRAVARGEILFNTKPIQITGVGGLNDALNIPLIEGTCTTCHSSPNIGNHSVGLPLNIGLTDASRRTPDMPLYTLQNKTTSLTVQTTDPGRALITGKWKGHRQIQRSNSKRLGRARSLLPQRLCCHTTGRSNFLRHAIRYRIYKSGEVRPDRVSAIALVQIGTPYHAWGLPYAWFLSLIVVYPRLKRTVKGNAALNFERGGRAAISDCQ